MKGHRHVKRRKRGRRLPPGTAPGTLHRDPDAPKAVLRVLAFGDDAVDEFDAVSVEQALARIGTRRVTWIDITGSGDADVLAALQPALKLHALALEDTVNLGQRPKVEEYPDHAYIVTRMPIAGARHESEQLSLFLGDGYVLTVQERPGDCLDPVRKRIRDRGPRLMAGGPDYLVYAVLDAAADAYFPVVEELRDELDAIEAAIIDRPTEAIPPRLHALKREIQEIRRVAGSLRELFNALVRGDTRRMSAEVQVFLRDCYDHAVQLAEASDGLRETANGLLEFYLSTLSNRMNEVMKVLTIIATVFIPLSFVAGLYGMNFDPGASPYNMPELAWRYGYPAALLVMAAVALVMLAYFWRKGWIGTGRRGGGPPKS